MQALVENLVKLQSIDLERARLNKDLRALPTEIAQSQARRCRRAPLRGGLSRRRSAAKRRCARDWSGRSTGTARRPPSFARSIYSVTTPAQAAAVNNRASSFPFASGMNRPAAADSLSKRTGPAAYVDCSTAFMSTTSRVHLFPGRAQRRIRTYYAGSPPVRSAGAARQPRIVPARGCSS